MTNPAREYRERLLQLLFRRAQGESISEIEATTELDRLWNLMTIKTQEETEVWYSGTGFQARKDLGLVDVVVKPGDRHSPRKEKM